MLFKLPSHPRANRAARVLFVSHTAKLSGAELVLKDVIGAFPGSSLALFESGPLSRAVGEADAVKLIEFGNHDRLARIRRDSNLLKSVFSLAALGALSARLAHAARSHDIVYANSQKAFVVGSLAGAIARRPVIWHLHDIISREHFGASQRQLQIALANRLAARVIVPSLSAASAFETAGGRPSIVKVIPNGLDVETEIADRSYLRSELGLMPGTTIGVFSRLAPWKGQHTVIRALPKLEGVNCIIVGDALFGEDDYAQSLKLLVRRLNLSHRVTFLGHRSDVPRLMRAVDIVVHPSVRPEPFGRTLVEAMLVQTPIIATGVGAPREVLGDGQFGMLVPPGDLDALVDAVRVALRPSEETCHRLAMGNQYARGRYSVVAMRRAIKAVVEHTALGEYSTA